MISRNTVSFMVALNHKINKFKYYTRGGVKYELEAVFEKVALLVRNIGVSEAKAVPVEQTSEHVKNIIHYGY